jgi:hypothetical protein
VVANTLQGSEKSNGNSANSHTNNTPAADSQSQDPTNIEDGGSSYEEDSDHADPGECCDSAPHMPQDWTADVYPLSWYAFVTVYLTGLSTVNHWLVGPFHMVG